MKRPPGLYEELLTRGLARELAELEARGFSALKSTPSVGQAKALLARHLLRLLTRTLAARSSDETTERQVEVARRVHAALNALDAESTDEDDALVEPPIVLGALVQAEAGPGGPPAITRPEIPLTSSDLLVNARGEPRIGHSIAAEIPSADRIDLVCAFIRWHGIRVIDNQIRRFREQGRPLRVITTVYTGSTERRALDRLVDLGAQVKVSYETQATRLHAKAWLFQRDSGYSTAYVGSSNLTHTALSEGVEWNVRISEAETPALLDKFRATFESYWADPSFEDYDPAKFADAIAAGRRGSQIVFLGLDVHPFPHQVEILERLQAEREIHGKHRNLVVAATGTGKTVVAALDYRRLSKDGHRPTLLFVAHRREILGQSLRTFRAVLHDANFGEELYEGRRPTEYKHVFASIQSLSRSLESLPPKHFQIVIVDEFHHAEANTYRALLDRLEPEELLGLTATPERADERDILARFDGRFASELRLWDALEAGLLCPFQYFGLHDNTDISHVPWSRKGYDADVLERVYTADDARAGLVIREVAEKHSDIKTMRALGFCVTIAHAEFMARKFNDAGIPALAVSANSREEERRTALQRLKAREMNILFAVDLFNEGIDVPEIDTVLFLRPTESATVFLQQLGRGLRRAEGKDCLTVLDFIGTQHRLFRFDARYRALLRGSGTGVTRQIREDFPFLPSGCSMQLDRVARDIVLKNVANAIGSTFQSLVTALHDLGRDVSLQEFLVEADVEMERIYRNGRTWMSLRREAGLPAPTPGPEIDSLSRGLERLLHVDDSRWLEVFRSALASSPSTAWRFSERETRILTGIAFTLFGPVAPTDIPEMITRLSNNPDICAEALELVSLLEAGLIHVTTPLEDVLDLGNHPPLSLHSHYSLEEILAALGRSSLGKRFKTQAGVLWERALKCDVFFVTLEKDPKHYSLNTRYNDYAISPEIFHWQSQYLTREAGVTGQRYINHEARGSHVLLFVRKTKDQRAYTFLGPVKYQEHRGERPMSITWRLFRPMPADFFREARVAAS
jgi:superfamily II DNA or RNA helicase/HKD family nuclease